MSKEGSTNEEDTEAVVKFLKSNVPKSDVPNVESELKKKFVLAKLKGKKLKKKPEKKKIKHLSRKEKKALGFYDIPRDGVKFKDVIPLNKVWEEYMSQILNTEKEIPSHTSRGWESFAQSIYKADFHGSLLRVIRSKCPSYVGKSGICIMDTRNTFKIVSKNDVVTTIPKRECVFEMYLREFKITLFGKHFCVKPAERSTKKIKSHIHPDLC